MKDHSRFLLTVMLLLSSFLIACPTHAEEETQDKVAAWNKILDVKFPIKK